MLSTRLGRASYARWRKRRAAAQVRDWQACGRPAPPPHCVKEQVLLRYARDYRLRTLVETGTQRGAMIAALVDEFATIHSIEIVPELYEHARRHFRQSPHVRLYCGDSARLLPQILAGLDEPALFWLDGHFNSGAPQAGAMVTPILSELACLFVAPRLGHVIVIDDVRLFRAEAGYPELHTVLASIEQVGGWDTLIEDDSLRLTPRRSAPLSP